MMTSMNLPPLTLVDLKREARIFADLESHHPEPSLYGVTDGKAVGTYLEAKFKGYLAQNYQMVAGNAASGLDLPALNLDIKTTSVRQPQSSSPFKSARQKIYGLGYDVLIFVYNKQDHSQTQTATLEIEHVIYIEAARSADFTLTRLILENLDQGCNSEDLVALMHDRMLPVDDIEASAIANEILEKRPLQGYLTISNALQWRLQYSRAIGEAGKIAGVEAL
jgi:hypothetical protein